MKIDNDTIKYIMDIIQDKRNKNYDNANLDYVKNEEEPFDSYDMFRLIHKSKMEMCDEILLILTLIKENGYYAEDGDYS